MFLCHLSSVSVVPPSASSVVLHVAAPPNHEYPCSSNTPKIMVDSGFIRQSADNAMQFFWEVLRKYINALGRPTWIPRCQQTPRTDFGRFRTSRVGVSGHFAHTTYCTRYTLLEGVILPIRAIPTRRPDSPPAPPRIHPKCCWHLEIQVDLTWNLAFIFNRQNCEDALLSSRRFRESTFSTVFTTGSKTDLSGLFLKSRSELYSKLEQYIIWVKTQHTVKDVTI